IHAEIFDTRSQATQAEAFFKSLSRMEKENYLRLHQDKNIWHKMD
ncbi:MAG: GIY-YIG nuclease family protein, partial [Tetragenococcus halophilus]|nr:GIY-YIG nuclease family protein [Tetragenococcus halophilus]